MGYSTEDKELSMFFFREGCTSSEDMFYKLSALKGFIDDLHWPEMELASHLCQRIELMSSDMIEACVKR